MPAKIPQPLGGVVAVMRIAAKRGLGDPAKAIDKPHDERLTRVSPKFLGRLGNVSCQRSGRRRCAGSRR